MILTSLGDYWKSARLQWIGDLVVMSIPWSERQHLN
jgi:hypothetical protein